MLKDVEWGKYKIGSLFEIGTGSLLSSNILQQGCIPRISAKSENNGIIGSYDTENIESARHFENFITVNFFGSDGGIFYHPYKASVEMKVHTLKIPNIKFDEAIGNFISCALKPALKGFGYGSQLSSSKLKDMNFEVYLPTVNHQIAYGFMQKFTSKITVDNLDKVKKHLIENGMYEVDLTNNEKEALRMLNNATWSLFNLKVLFGNATRGKRLKSEDRKLGLTPFVTAGEADEGVSAFISNDVTIFNRNTTTIDMFGSAKYRNYDYGCDDHVAVVHTEELPKYASIFVTTAINKSSYNGQFNYGRNFYAKDADNLNILLPSKNGKPDYEFMENYMSAIHKLMIKKVAFYLDEKKSKLAS